MKQKFLWSCLSPTWNWVFTFIVELLKAHCGCKNWSSVWWWADGWVCWTEIAAILHITYQARRKIWGRWGTVGICPQLLLADTLVLFQLGGRLCPPHTKLVPLLFGNVPPCLITNWKSSPSWAYWTPKSSMDTIDKNHLSHCIGGLAHPACPVRPVFGQIWDGFR